MNRARSNRITAALLAAGLGAAAIVYLAAPAEADDDGFDDPLHNKKYVHELKVLGGQANVLAAEFQDWFAAQWQGRTLARTIAVLTVVSALGYRFIATHPDEESGEDGEKPPPPPA